MIGASRKVLPAIPLLILSFAASAQKLSDIQEASLRAPVNIKVDGKLTEWNNQFQAYNKATEIFYTISNDDDKLFLTVQATDLDIINKIICAGIIFTINGSGKMKDESGMAVTYPVLDRNSFPVNSPPINFDDDVKAMNQDFTNQAKDIKVTGINGIPNTLISIYNPEGIKAAALFNEEKVFTYELAIPLKHLGLTVKGSKPFVYNIKLKSLEGGGNPVADFNLPPNTKWAKASQAQRKEVKVHMFKGGLDRITNTAIFDDRYLSLLNPTDFWGEYTLAK